MGRVVDRRERGPQSLCELLPRPRWVEEMMEVISEVVGERENWITDHLLNLPTRLPVPPLQLPRPTVQVGVSVRELVAARAWSVVALTVVTITALLTVLGITTPLTVLITSSTLLSLSVPGLVLTVLRARRSRGCRS